MSPTSNETLLKVLRADRAHIRSLEARDRALAPVVNDTGVTVVHGDIVALSDSMDEAVEICAGPIPDIASGGALGNHDHSGDVGDGGTFDASNLTSGASTDGQVLMSDGVGGAAWEDVLAGLLEGADIDMSVAHTVARAGNVVLLFSGAGNLLAEYARTAVGLAAALAAAAAGDIVKIPAGTITGDITIGAGITVKGMGWASIISGMATLGVGSRLENVQVYQSVNTATDIIGIIGPDTGEATIRDVQVSLTQAGVGKSLGLLSNGGTLRAYECEVWAHGATGSTWGVAAIAGGIVEVNQGQVRAWV